MHILRITQNESASNSQSKPVDADAQLLEASDFVSIVGSNLVLVLFVLFCNLVLIWLCLCLLFILVLIWFCFCLFLLFFCSDLVLYLFILCQVCWYICTDLVLLLFVCSVFWFWFVSCLFVCSVTAVPLCREQRGGGRAWLAPTSAPRPEWRTRPGTRSGTSCDLSSSTSGWGTKELKYLPGTILRCRRSFNGRTRTRGAQRCWERIVNSIHDDWLRVDLFNPVDLVEGWLLTALTGWRRFEYEPRWLAECWWRDDYWLMMTAEHGDATRTRGVLTCWERLMIIVMMIG